MDRTTKNNPVKKSEHQWKFFRSGGFDQVRIETPDDLIHLDELDQKLWAVLSCPVKGIELDARTARLIDTDGDGRIRVPEVINAVKWTCSILKNLEGIFEQQEKLKLDSIKSDDPAGQRILGSAREILSNLGNADAKEISASDTADINKIFCNTRFNGDGVIPPESASDEKHSKAIADIISCAGSVMDRSGKPGVNLQLVDDFYKEARDFIEWNKLESNHVDLRKVFSTNLGEAFTAFVDVRDKISDYFIRCRLAEFDGRAKDVLNPAISGYEQVNSRVSNMKPQDFQDLPVSWIEPGAALSLKQRINPAWVVSMERFRQMVVVPSLGEIDALDEADWDKIKSQFTDYESWIKNKKGSSVEKLGLERVLELVDQGYYANIVDLIREDKKLEPEAEAIAEVDKLVLFHRDLLAILNNFVSLKDFYNTEKPATFQIGDLYLDQRCCKLCVKVDDIGKHSSVAALSGTYLAYCDCTRKTGSEKLSIAAAVTNGDSDNIAAGRNGVFYDRTGQDWDATIVKLVEHPISIRQAFWSPYKRVIRLIAEQAEKYAAASDKATQESAAKGIGSVSEAASKATTEKPPAPPPFDVGKFAGIFAAIGLAIGAIGTAIASVVTGFMKLAWWQMPLALIGLMLVISGPSMLLAYFKLRKRNLAPILDANGWAVNTRARMTIPFGTALTVLAALPPGSERSLRDPYAEKKSPWPVIVLIILFILLLIGLYHWGYLDGVIQAVLSRLMTR